MKANVVEWIGILAVILSLGALAITPVAFALYWWG